MTNHLFGHNCAKSCLLTTINRIWSITARHVRNKLITIFVPQHIDENSREKNIFRCKMLVKIGQSITIKTDMMNVRIGSDPFETTTRAKQIYSSIDPFVCYVRVFGWETCVLCVLISFPLQLNDTIAPTPNTYHSRHTLSQAEWLPPQLIISGGG